MIRGEVNANNKALIPFQLHGPHGQIEAETAQIDTGFSGYLTLSPARVGALQLPSFSTSEFELGDGSRVMFNIYTAVAVWDGHDRDIFVLASEGGALVGMRMLHGYRLLMDVVDGGEVLIEERLPSPPNP
ncbi:MAG TPA: hypothetical protein VFB21_00570 [Chthonomonadaceae bacterium]|nr:hypothetical protein [Chthonomonadaceae bacterium]